MDELDDALAAVRAELQAVRIALKAEQDARSARVQELAQILKAEEAGKTGLARENQTLEARLERLRLEVGKLQASVARPRGGVAR
jgi:hypothetical protein